MQIADEAVIRAFERLFGNDIIEEVVDAAVAMIAPSKEAIRTDHASAGESLTRVESEIERLVSAIAAGGQMNALLQALKSRESERERLRRQMTSAASAVQRTAKPQTKLRQELKAHFNDWRGVLRRQPVQARQVLKKLLDGPLIFTPQNGFYTFEVTSASRS